jgi:hypothetical protein
MMRVASIPVDMTSAFGCSKIAKTNAGAGEREEEG